MKLIVGLGNPGKDYEKTRHNVGFMLIDKLLGEVKFKEKFNGLFFEMISNGEKVIFIKPQTFMNNSGECIGKFVKYYGIEPQDIMVIHDDLDINVGNIKFKINSSSGGHNGIKSNENHNVIDFVLGKFSKNELDLFDFNKASNAIDDFINNDYEYVMNKYNGK